MLRKVLFLYCVYLWRKNFERFKTRIELALEHKKYRKIWDIRKSQVYVTLKCFLLSDLEDGPARQPHL